MFVRIRMVLDTVARIVQRLDAFRVFIHPLAHDEKGRLRLVFAQHFDQFLRIFVAPRGVEGEAGFFFRRFHAVDRQQLPARGGYNA